MLQARKKTEVVNDVSSSNFLILYLFYFLISSLFPPRCSFLVAPSSSSLFSSRCFFLLITPLSSLFPPCCSFLLAPFYISLIQTSFFFRICKNCYFIKYDVSITDHRTNGRTDKHSYRDTRTDRRISPSPQTFPRTQKL